MQIIEIGDEYKKDIKDADDEVDIAYVAFHEASKMLKLAKDNLWETIGKAYPETKESICSFDPNTMQIIVRKRKPEDEDESKDKLFISAIDG